MNKLPITITMVCFCLIFGGCIGIVIGKATTHPLICKITDWQHPDGKIVRCQRVGSDVAGPRETEIEPTATIEYYTATPTEWEPLPYATMTPTERPYPTQDTGEPYP